MKGKSKKKTPVRSALKKGSSLHSKVEDGIGALEKPHRRYLAEDLHRSFADSLDLDKATHEGHEQENRWDYLLGHTPSGEVIALEPHSAKRDQITMVIKKRAAAKEQLRDHLRPGARVTAWLWVASGKVHFADTEKARRRLDQHGIRFVGKRVSAKHQPAAKQAKAGRR